MKVETTPRPSSPNAKDVGTPTPLTQIRAIALWTKSKQQQLSKNERELEQGEKMNKYGREREDSREVEEVEFLIAKERFCLEHS